MTIEKILKLGRKNLYSHKKKLHKVDGANATSLP